MEQAVLTTANPQVLQASQLRERKLYKENIGQKRKIKSLEKGQVKRRRGTVTSEHDEEIKDIARKFAIMGEPWLDDASFKQERPAMSADSSERYKSTQRIAEGIIAELYDAVPTKLLGMLQNENHFKDLFIHQVNQQRSSTVLRIKREIAPLIFGGNASRFAANYDRESEAEFQKLLKFDTSSHKYPKLAPILYPDLKKNAKKLFRCLILVKILKGTLWGPSSVESNASSRVRPKTVGHKWNIKQSKISPGSIAFAAIVARFVVLPDTEFGPVGDRTKIKYRDDFNEYKKILIEKKNSKSIRSLFSWYNTALLDNHGEDTQPQDDGSDKDDNEIQDALDQLDGSEDGDEQASGDHSGSESGGN
ncbi:hypothetical protein PILCRDRAFT_90384 [Piloderma croceum F 1598]|uniref:Uncharacterized protein n=1 Tax=Piloderma croceum (strain F 1598) TaxID=765440 RepID=A0A0C3FFS8_PILCF|nr:hypothetical protein PILCRDRAFT_90384 [Piloderma croceum F 1598]